MKFLKEHLTGFYDWKPEAEIAMYDGNATRRLFDRWNGNQVLFVINVFLSNTGNMSIERGKMAESLILERLPLDTMSEVSVLNWLQTEIVAEQVQQ